MSCWQRSNNLTVFMSPWSEIKLSCVPNKNLNLPLCSHAGGSQLEVKLVLLWKHNMRIEYLAVTPWPLDPSKRSTWVEVTMEGSYDILHDISCTMRKPITSLYRTTVIRRFWNTLQRWAGPSPAVPSVWWNQEITSLACWAWVMQVAIWTQGPKGICSEEVAWLVTSLPSSQGKDSRWPVTWSVRWLHGDGIAAPESWSCDANLSSDCRPMEVMCFYSTALQLCVMVTQGTTPHVSSPEGPVGYNHFLARVTVTPCCLADSLSSTSFPPPIILLVY